MFRPRRADMAGTIGGRCRQWPVCCPQQSARDRMIWHPDGNSRQPSRDKVAEPTPRPTLNHERQRTWPKRQRQPLSLLRDLPDASRLGEIWHMHNQWIEAGPTLGLENARHRFAVASVRTQAVDCLGRKCHEGARPQAFPGPRNRTLIGRVNCATGSRPRFAVAIMRHSLVATCLDVINSVKPLSDAATGKDRR